MRSRYSRGGGMSYSQQNFVEGFKSAGGVRDVVQPIIPPPVITSPIIEEKAPVIEEPIVEEKVIEVVETVTPTPQPTSTPEPTVEKEEKKVVFTPTSTPEPTVSVLRSIPTQKHMEKPIRTSNFKSKL